MPPTHSDPHRALLLQLEGEAWRACQDSAVLRELLAAGWVEVRRRPGQLPEVRLTGAGGRLATLARQGQGTLAQLAALAHAPEVRAARQALGWLEDAQTLLRW
ncbi:MAG: hypothetical protein EOO70_02805, partial [Myxococcaceae bacterium]